MIPAVLCALAITGAPPAVADATAAGEPAIPRTREDLRAAYRDLMQQTAAGRRPDPAEVVPALVELHRELSRVEGLSFQERGRLQGGVESRLLLLRARLIRDAKIRETSARTSDSSLAGGGANGAAQQLISLITTTIEPDSWSVNGGEGTIGYYAVPQPVLVIRQTGEVHHQIGAVLGNLHR